MQFNSKKARKLLIFVVEIADVLILRTVDENKICSDMVGFADVYIWFSLVGRYLEKVREERKIKEEGGGGGGGGLSQDEDEEVSTERERSLQVHPSKSCLNNIPVQSDT